MRKERLFGIFSRIPTLETDRIILRGMKVSDTDDMFDYARRADVTRFLTWRPHRDRSYTKQYLEYLGTLGEPDDRHLRLHEDRPLK